MKMPKLSGRTKALPFLVAAGLIGAGVVVKESTGSDHVDTAEVELSPTLDLNDV
jgi:hypothetical protein